ncbi:MAG TPA: winged helix DNA-binding protein [Devosia sp.]|jgi:predicted transcriptional regulator|uniref:MarR family winged helix-turn-helix transcriptional regulator n=1 Tax=Devosia sp. TaxID=1871048 RepID=UPI002DDCE95B|nr:winged helix DNA-binding protein [Devosia sp.]HEV2516413.1 winged helix DNA-binding protein [Devosia sp.]
MRFVLQNALAKDGMVEAVRRLISAGAIYGSSMPKGLQDVTIVLKLFVNGELGEELCVKQVLADSGISATGTLRRIESLEAAGLVRRQPDGDDARRVRVSLTERGRNMVIAMVQQVYGPVPGPYEVGDARS